MENMLKQLQHPVGSSPGFCTSDAPLVDVGCILLLFLCIDLAISMVLKVVKLTGWGGIIVSKSAKCIGISFCLLSFSLPFFVYHN